MGCKKLTDKLNELKVFLFLATFVTRKYWLQGSLVEFVVSSILIAVIFRVSPDSKKRPCEQLRYVEMVFFVCKIK